MSYEYFNRGPFFINVSDEKKKKLKKKSHFFFFFNLVCHYCAQNKVNIIGNRSSFHFYLERECSEL